MRLWIPILLALVLMRSDSPADSADAAIVAGSPSRPFCLLRSEVLPRLEIRLQAAEGATSLWRGWLYRGEQKIMSFQLSMLQGYGSRIWSVPGSQDRGEYTIPFSSGMPLMSLKTQAKVDAFLFAGLGEELHARGDNTDVELSRAGEGFWTPGHECRDRFLFGT